jgi:hypothetical protein
MQNGIELRVKNSKMYSFFAGAVWAELAEI